MFLCYFERIFLDTKDAIHFNNVCYAISEESTHIRCNNNLFFRIMSSSVCAVHIPYNAYRNEYLILYLVTYVKSINFNDKIEMANMISTMYPLYQIQYGDRSCNSYAMLKISKCVHNKSI